ncbi:GumC family protein [Thiothrix lacustris]|uniref:non-specific protein-tyrosine kinase n=1 Tax=Thiothrix lacustris TaxID=525917 RepID=A0ABY9MTX3_9GAMM|nr:polysaccharide biosynthesis tyrosine autokinase [Thiothrix lacustris]WML92012.1 polysaccharide biosynthesis tyrosine autokinase [Thiothrix lacustris]WMP16170.1 polysaccharide biosynthesis tyrosine autokinase [Thiothrix lacustris]
MENYYTNQSKNLEVRAQGNTQVVEYIPVEEIASKAQVEEFGFGELWRRLMQRKWLLLGVAFSTFLAAIILTMTSPNVYRATTTLQVTPEDGPALNLGDGDGAGRAPMSEREFYLTQTELLRSERLTKTTLDKLGIASRFESEDSVKSKAYAWLESLKRSVTGDALVDDKAHMVEENFTRLLSIYPVENSQIFKISYDHSDPKLAADVVNTLADSYKQMSFDLRNERVAHTKEILTEKLAAAKSELEVSENKLVAYAKKQGIITLDGDRSSASGVMDGFNAALTEATGARIAAEAAFNRSKNVAGADRALENPAIQALKEELARAQAEYRDKSRLFKPGFPEMQQLQGRISELGSEIAKESSSIDSTARGKLQAEFEAAKQREAELKSEVKRQEGVLIGQRDKSPEYNTLQRKVEAERRNYDGLLTRLGEVRLAEDSGASNVAVVDVASVPSKPYAPNILLNLAMGAAIGLLLGLLAAIMAEIMDDRLRSIEDMKRALSSVPLLGVIPYISGRNNKNVLALRGQVGSSFMLEAFRSLRENILMMKSSPDHGLALLMNVTSPAPSEGKTTTAVNLATVFAYTGKRVLLIDCDMRHPEAHNKLGLENRIGVSDFLLGQQEVGDLVQETTVQNLYAISAGSAVPNPTELLAGERFTALLSELGGMFDHIIIDGPPVMGLADALIISNRTGNTVFVSAYGQTRKRSMKDAFGRLSQAQCNIIGTVLTKMKSPEVSNKYYGYPNRYPRSGQTAMVATR